jgi:hypothetical protein
MSNLRACGPLTYTDNEHVKQLLYVLDDHVWGMKITSLEESADFATLDTEKLFSKLKSHELSRKGRPNYDALFTSKALITSTRIGGHDANPTNTSSPSLEFALSSFLQLLMSNMRAFLTTRLPCLQKKFGRCTSFGRRGEETLETPKRKNNRPKRKKKNNYKKKNHFGDKKKKNTKKIMS